MTGFRHGNRITALTANAVCGALLLSGCTAGTTEPPNKSVISSPQEIATDLGAPWSLTFAQELVLLSERDSGRILEIDAQRQVHPVAQLADISHGGEGGLLGLAYKYPHLFVYSTGDNGNRIQRFALSGKSGQLTLGEPQTLISHLPAGAIHNGGRLAFGPDGMLYATVGDAGTSQRAQSLDDLGGKILRLTSEGKIPEDNPFPDSPIYSFGHRNPQGIAWDETGVMYASEFGQSQWDELNVITAGTNYGWPEVEGVGNQPDFEDPILQWTTDQASPSGIAIHDGLLYLANLRGERLRVVDLADPSSSSEIFVQEFGRLRDVAVTAEGELWILTNNTDGRGSPNVGDDRILGFDLEALELP